MKKNYKHRLVENSLERKLKSSGCVLVTGPKFCGKSTMCGQFAESSVELNTKNNIDLANANPESILAGETPHLIDEWQKVPELWNIIKADLDKDYVFGKYIITGSTTPVDPKAIQHSGAGRISELMLKPFTLFESGESKGLVSIGELFDSEDAFPFVLPKDNKTSLNDIAFLICRGGWPVALNAEKEFALDVTTNYYEGLFRIEDESDEYAEFLKNKDIELLKVILRSYARNISTQAKKTKMIDDIIQSGIRSTLDEDTFNCYQKILKALFIIYDLPAWNLNLRTSVAVRTAPTHHFVDTSIATAALGITPADLMNDLQSFGYFFEDFVIRDLSVYAQANNAGLKHYRDSSGQEVDAIYEAAGGEYVAIEVKIASQANIDDGIKSLNAFERKMAGSKLKTPKIKMIITSHGACYRDQSGVYVVPITYLKN